MAVKEENEVTVKVICTKEELLNCLLEKGFKKGETFSLDDYYYIPSGLNIEKMSVREILSKTIILRYIVHGDIVTQIITFKIKNIDDDGNIINQRAINCNVYDIDEAKNLFKSIGYYEIMNLKEEDVIYYKDGFELALKFVKNRDILIEIETEANTQWDTIDNIKNILLQLNIPIEKDNFFVKKAENELKKILKR